MVNTRNNTYPIFIETLSPKKEREKPSVERNRHLDSEKKVKKKKIKNTKKIINMLY